MLKLDSWIMKSLFHPIFTPFFNRLMFRLGLFLLPDERKGPSVLLPNCSGPGEEAG